MIETLDELATFIEKRSREVWDSQQSPYLLANVSPELKSQGVDYRALIAPQTLKQYVNTLGDRVQLVQHSVNKARVGVIPQGEAFSFDDPAAPAAVQTKGRQAKRAHDPRFTVLNFLEALGRLSDEESAKVTIPVQVLAKMISRDDN
jgi:hypothetical protein